jgi:hypothetical protein
MDEMIRAKRDLARLLRGHPDVTGLSVGSRRLNGRRTDDLAIVVSVGKKRPSHDLAIDRRLPAQFGRYRVDVLERTLDVRPLGSCPTDRPGLGESCRPLRAGTLLTTYKRKPLCAKVNGKPSHNQISELDGLTHGTLGCVVIHSSGKVCALTNQHVATSDLISDDYPPTGSAREFIGVRQWQGYPALNPATAGPQVLRDKREYDRARSCCFWLCGAAADPPPVGRVFFVADSPMDAALVALTGGLEYRNELPEGLQMGQPLSQAELTQTAIVGTEVIKRGHMTHLTTGIVTDIDLAPDRDVSDPLSFCLRTSPPSLIIEPTQPAGGQNDGQGYFQKQGILHFAVEGDSGSIVLRKSDARIVGLLYGGLPEVAPNSQGIDSQSAVAIDIQRVMSALSIASIPTGGGTSTVPNNNLDGVPTRSYRGINGPGGFAPAMAEVDDERLWTFRQLIAQSPRGAAVLARFERMREEISDLMGKYRRVRIAWHKNHGPTLGWKFQRMLLEPTVKLPEVLVDKPLRACIEEFSTAIADVSSTELRQDLALLPDLAAALPSMTRDDLLQHLGAPPWHGSP